MASVAEVEAALRHFGRSGRLHMFCQLEEWLADWKGHYRMGGPGYCPGAMMKQRQEYYMEIVTQAQYLLPSPADRVGAPSCAVALLSFPVGASVETTVLPPMVRACAYHAQRDSV